jgi:hypothetical protein
LEEPLSLVRVQHSRVLVGIARLVSLHPRYIESGALWQWRLKLSEDGVKGCFQIESSLNAFGNRLRHYDRLAQSLSGMTDALYRFADIELDSSQYELRRQGRILRLEKLDILIPGRGKGPRYSGRDPQTNWGKDVLWTRSE